MFFLSNDYTFSLELVSKELNHFAAILHVYAGGLNFMKYTQSPFIRTGPIRLGAVFWGKFKTRALGSSNLRTTSKNLKTASAQIFKAKNRVLSPFSIHMYISFTCTYISLNFSIFLVYS